ncbi:hypothetical protein GCM10012288_19970 [Malaciobacter pacificus]|uniref:Heme-binding uptake protein ChaN n=1 Tax=Malaciobacter pacificus TaxID=1080223 RepID=A0A5C2H3Q7_9BACT|nr:ChaN family lipoprotein [Malaciobacter pacificus]QEP33607.1 heme-binding uptake protein ChaN [Malaciobacter pacificus]GGD45646.1 hypothetical protein GCM10012288_19970 [Malaciobacter pacificus]
MIKIILTLIITIFLFSACSQKKSTLSFTHDLEKKEGIYSLKQAKYISIEELVKEIEHYPIIFVGDHHNTKKTHDFFESLLIELDKKNYKLHLANEWFSPSHDKLLENYTNDVFDSQELKNRRKWEKFTSFKWEYVEPLYEIVKKNNGKLYGINLSKEDRKKISLKSFDKMNNEEKIFYDSLDLNVSVHRNFVMPYLSHCSKIPQKTDEKCEERMYRVQVSWDTYMAQNVAKISKFSLKSPKDKLIVFAGAMHIEHDLGIPLRFSRFSNLPFFTISNEKILKEKDIKVKASKADVIYIYE